MSHKNVVNIKNQSAKAHLLLLRLITLSLCMSPISSGKYSSLLECRKSTVAFFQLPNCEKSKARLLSPEQAVHTEWTNGC